MLMRSCVIQRDEDENASQPPQLTLKNEHHISVNALTRNKTYYTLSTFCYINLECECTEINECIH